MLNVSEDNEHLGSQSGNKDSHGKAGFAHRLMQMFKSHNTQAPLLIKRPEKTDEDIKLDKEFFDNLPDVPIKIDCQAQYDEFMQKMGYMKKTGKMTKKWFNLENERSKVRDELHKQAVEVVFEENRIHYLNEFSELKKQWAEKLNQNHDKVLQQTESDLSLKNIYEQIIQSIFTTNSGIQFEVYGAGNITGEEGGDSKGFGSKIFDPELKKMILSKNIFLRPDVDERHKSILPVEITENNKDQQNFQERLSHYDASMMPKGYKNKRLFIVQQQIQGEEGNAYFSDRRNGHHYDIGIGIDPDINSDSVKLEEILGKLPETDLRKIMDMTANTFIPEYNQAILALAHDYKNK